MKAKPYRELLDRTMSRERQQAKDRETARILLEQLTVRELQKICGLSEDELAERLEDSRVRASEFDRSGDMMLGSLRALVEARVATSGFKCVAATTASGWSCARHRRNLAG